MRRFLSPEQARRFYDRFGARQDQQGFYEDRPLARLIDLGRFDTARSVFEFGCGTGRLAAMLFAHSLGPEATYQGIDISGTMVDLARARTGPWQDRARVVLHDGVSPLPGAVDGYDRFVSTYVLDLLREDTIHSVLAEAHRILAPGGLLCLAGITHGNGVLPRLISMGWSAVHTLRPALVGGCRPISIANLLQSNRWEVLHREVVAPWGISSEVLVAGRRG